MFTEIRKLLADFCRQPGVAEAESAWVPPTRLDAGDVVAASVLHSGLTKGRPEDVAFYVEAWREGVLNFRDVRKRGTPLTAEEKRALGVKGRAILTREFVETLNESGLADPEMAAQMIAAPAAHRASTANNLHQARQAGMEQEKFRFGQTAAGHCSYSKRMNGKVVRIDEAVPLPALDCKHPDQCGCRWQSHIG